MRQVAFERVSIALINEKLLPSGDDMRRSNDATKLIQDRGTRSTRGALICWRSLVIHGDVLLACDNNFPRPAPDKNNAETRTFLFRDR